jgi:hypothetical protein
VSPMRRQRSRRSVFTPFVNQVPDAEAAECYA